MPRKKQRTQIELIDEDDSSSNSNDMDRVDEQINVDFEARSPEDVDYDSIKLLLNQKLGNFQLNLGELSEIIIQQGHIGNVIHQVVEDEPEMEPSASSASNMNNNNDDTIFGIISLINLAKYKQKDSIKQLTSFINKELHKLKKLDNKSKEFLDKNLFDKYKIGYLINERYINIPTEISVPMYESLMKDLEETNNNDVAKSSNNMSDNDFEYYMLLSRSFEPDSGASKERDYTNSEEEVFKEFSDYIFEIKYPKVNDSQFNFFLEILFLNKTKLADALIKIKNIVKSK
jgi:protein BCP1